MNKIQAGRLLTLAWFLRNLKGQFSMSLFCKNTDTTLKGNELLLDCGTNACALGWSAWVFPDIFKLDLYDNTSFYPNQRSGLRKIISIQTGEDISLYGDFIRKFFGIEELEALNLFGSASDRTALEEAIVIEKLVYSKGWTYE